MKEEIRWCDKCDAQTVFIDGSCSGGKIGECARVLSFSDRYLIGKKADEWCDANNVPKNGMGVVCAINALGYAITERPSDEG